MANGDPLAGAVVLVLSLALLLQATQGGSTAGSSAPYVPVRAVVYRSAPAAATAAEAYEPFELCMGCRCCPAAAGGNSNNNGSSSCVETQCCYTIDCNIPGKPFGVCAFSPRTCGCANNCTQPAA